MANGVDVATLGVKVTLDGAQQAAAGLDQVASSGTRAEASTRRVTGATDGLTASQRFLMQQGISLDAVLDRVNGTSAALAVGTGEVTAAVEAEAVAHTEAAAAAGVHGLQLGRLNQELGTAIGRLTGTNTAMTRLTAQVGGAVAGYGEMIAVLAALAGALEIYKAWTEDAHTASAEQDKLTKSLLTWYETQSLGSDGKLSKEIDAMTAKIKALHAEMDSLMAGKFFAGVESIGQGGSKLDAWIRIFTAGNPAQMAEQMAAEIAKGTASVTKQIDTDGKAVAAAQAEAAKKIAAAADKAQKDRLHAMEAIWIGAKPVVDVDQQKVLTALLKQADEMRSVNTEANKAMAQSAQAAQLANAEGYARQFLVIQFKAENDALAARSKLAGPALTYQLATIEATRQQSIATLNQTTATKDARDAQKLMNEMGVDARKVVSENAKALAEGTADTKAFTDETLRFADSIQKDLLRAIDQFTSRGIVSWSSFFSEASRLSTDFVGKYSSEIDKLTAARDAAMKKAATDQNAAQKQQELSLAASIDRQIQQYQKLQKAAGYASIAIAGGTAGYNIGQQTGNPITGALGGAAVGALAGAEIGSVIPGIGTAVGAVVGGVAGLVGGLFGAADKIKDLRKQEEADEKTFIAHYTSFSSQYAQTNAQILADYQTLVDAAKKAKEAVSASATAAEQQALGDNRSAFVNALGQTLNSLSGPAGDYTNQLYAINKAYSDNIATAKALGLGQSYLDEIEEIRTKQLDALAKATAENNAQITYSLDAREAYAKGLTAEGDAITRRAAEQKELFDDGVAGYTDDQLARVKYIQGLEDTAAAEKKAADEAERYTQSMASLTASFLSLTGQADAAAKANLDEQQRQATKQLTDAGGTPQELALLGVVQLFQRGQLDAQQQIAHQTDAINAQLKVSQDALSVAQSQLQALQQAASSLKTFDQSLNTGSLSPLSPIDQLNAAKAERDRLFAAAQGGDTAAAGQYGAAAQAFLQLSQGYNASGAGYQSDYATTKAQADALSTQYEHQASLQQQTVDALNAQITLLQNQLATLQDANTLTQMTRDAVIAELKADRDAALVPNGAMIDQLNALRDTLTGVGRDIVTSERDILVGDQNNVTAATQAEINAINSGASALQIAQLDAVRQLEIQKTAQDDYYANQLAETAKIYGWDSPQVQSIIDLQTKYDTGVQNQINAINGIGPSVAGAMRQFGFGQGPDTTPQGGLNSPTFPGSTQPTGGTTTVSGTFFSLDDPFLGYAISLPAGTTSYTDIDGDSWTASGGWTPAPGNTQLLHYANGGDFGGGLRLVGEMGPELEATGPSRITSTETLLSALKNGGNNAELIAEVKALRSAVTALYEVNRAGANATVEGLSVVASKVDANTDKTVRGLERITSKIA